MATVIDICDDFQGVRRQVKCLPAALNRHRWRAFGTRHPLTHAYCARPVSSAGRASPLWMSAPSTWADKRSGDHALRQALPSPALVITGGPGVGKTTMVNAILLSRMLVAESQPRREREPEVR